MPPSRDEQRHEASHLADLHAREAFDTGFDVVILGIEAMYPDCAAPRGDKTSDSERPRGDQALPELSDGRLRLRALRPEDKPAVVRGLNDPECGRFLWAPPYPYAESDFDDFLELQKTAWPERRNAFWTITDAASRRGARRRSPSASASSSRAARSATGAARGRAAAA